MTTPEPQLSKQLQETLDQKLPDLQHEWRYGCLFIYFNDSPMCLEFNSNGQIERLNFSDSIQEVEPTIIDEPKYFSYLQILLAIIKPYFTVYKKQQI